MHKPTQFDNVGNAVTHKGRGERGLSLQPTRSSWFSRKLFPDRYGPANGWPNGIKVGDERGSQVKIRPGHLMPGSSPALTDNHDRDDGSIQSSNEV